jgi:hypothetical protein
MTADQFLQAKFELLAEQAKHTDYINAKFTEIGQAFLKANCQFEIGQTVDINGRQMVIQHIEPLTWFEFVIIRLYGTYDNGDLEQNGITLTDKITLSCQDKQTE